MGKILFSNAALSNQIVDNLRASEGTAQTVIERFKALQQQLGQVNTTAEFYALVQQIIATGKEVRQLLQTKTKEMDGHIMPAVMAYIAKNPGFTNVKQLFNYTDTATQTIIATKERISRDELLLSLPDAQKLVVVTFIDSVKALKPISTLLEQQAKRFQARLGDVDSFEEVDQIENDIQRQHALLNGVIKDLIAYPQDKEVAAQLSRFLQTNGHLRSIMRYFDLNEALMDEVLFARARIASNYMVDAPMMQH